MIKIFGRTHSLKGGGTKFKGVIKKIDSEIDEGLGMGVGFKGGIGKSKSFSQIQEQALTDVVGSVASSITKSGGRTAEGVSSVASSEPIFSKSITRTEAITKQKPIQIIKMDKELNRVASLTAEVQKVSPKTKQIVLTKTKQGARQSQALDTALVEIDKQIVSQTQKLAQATEQPLKQISALISPTTTIPSGVSGMRIIPPPFALREKKRISALEKKYPSWDVMIKSKGKFRKVTKKPVDLISARDLRAYALDHSTARSGRIKSRTIKSSPLQYAIPRGYSEQTRRKFRAFKQKKGVKTPLRKTIIEINPFLIDTRGEKQGLSSAKLLAQRRRKQSGSNDFNIPRSLYSSQRRVVASKRKNKPIGLEMA